MKESDSSHGYAVSVVGGAGHVGAPLSVVLAARGLRTLVYDINPKQLELLRSGVFPFIEEGGEELLGEVLRGGNLGFASEREALRLVPVLILTIGTPIDEFHNPVRSVVTRCVEELLPYLDSARLIILRSTVSPGTTEELDRFLSKRGKKIAVAFCPERVVQGRAVQEIQSMAQIVSGTTPEAEAMAAEIFERVAPRIVRMRPREAEFAKLICNAYRYIQFAATNQFYMMVEEAGCDYRAVLEGLKADYPRMRDLPGPGFAAGPCLHKDTLQLAASTHGNFGMGHAAIQVNEGLPAYLVSRMKREFDLEAMTVGVLGMAFKAESDDTRSSLSYRLKKLLTHEAKAVLCTDPFVKSDSSLLDLEEVLEKSDVLVIGTPHRLYAEIELKKPVVDVWNLRRC